MPFTYQFPDPATADHDGLLAVGGDLSQESLITAYSQGIFPWFTENSPILWWSPDPRMVLFPSKFILTDSLRQSIKNSGFTVRIDSDFASVIEHCEKAPRKGQDGTWITKEMKQAYINLHKKGLAHSFETWHNDELAGGLYGVSLGRAFFGESMFYLKRDASKFALYALTQWCLSHEFHFIDAQQSTSHLKSLGAEDIPRHLFLKLLKEALKFETIANNWNISSLRGA
ncbi:MAG TPA: leucyl/phenylalanyl-tRNA--protein transferase [Bacteroidales bacterium]|nr:leucyl/phenylalanyl-tRNA--protein transferase [Bacteroidales bacterium]